MTTTTLTITTDLPMSGPEQETFDRRIRRRGKQVSPRVREYDLGATDLDVAEDIASDLRAQWCATVTVA